MVLVTFFVREKKRFLVSFVLVPLSAHHESASQYLSEGSGGTGRGRGSRRSSCDRGGAHVCQALRTGCSMGDMKWTGVVRADAWRTGSGLGPVSSAPPHLAAVMMSRASGVAAVETRAEGQVSSSRTAFRAVATHPSTNTLPPHHHQHHHNHPLHHLPRTPPAPLSSQNHADILRSMVSRT